MNLSSIMTTNVVTIGPDDSLDDAIALFNDHNFRHLPVIRQGALLSLLSRRDLSLASGWLTIEERKRQDQGGPTFVREIMRDRIVTLTPNHAVETAASMMVGKRAGAIPILEEFHLVGIVTASDLLGAIRKRNSQAEWGKGRVESAKVSDYMESRPESLPPQGEVAEAYGLCVRKDLRHLAITQQGEIVGLVSEYELRYELEENADVEDQRLSDVMVTDLVTIGPDEDLAVAADSMIENGVSALPVVDDRELVGLLTNSDVIQHYTAKFRVPPIK